MMRSAAAPYLGSPVSLLRWMNSICTHGRKLRFLNPLDFDCCSRIPGHDCVLLMSTPLSHLDGSQLGQHSAIGATGPGSCYTALSAQVDGASGYPCGSVKRRHHPLRNDLRPAGVNRPRLMDQPVELPTYHASRTAELDWTHSVNGGVLTWSGISCLPKGHAQTAALQRPG